MWNENDGSQMRGYNRNIAVWIQNIYIILENEVMLVHYRSKNLDYNIPSTLSYNRDSVSSEFRSDCLNTRNELLRILASSVSPFQANTLQNYPTKMAASSSERNLIIIIGRHGDMSNAKSFLQCYWITLNRFHEISILINPKIRCFVIGRGSLLNSCSVTLGCRHLLYSLKFTYSPSICKFMRFSDCCDKKTII